MGRVVIRTKKKCHGTMLSVYLEFCPPFTDNSGKQVRYEFLNLEKYTTPANDAQRKFNTTIDDIDVSDISALCIKITSSYPKGESMKISWNISTAISCIVALSSKSV